MTFIASEKGRAFYAVDVPTADRAWLAVETVVEYTNRHRVLLVHSNDRRWLWVKSVLKMTPAVEVVGEAASVGEAIDAVETLRPVVALLAGEMVPGGSRDVVRELRQAGPTTTVILVGERSGADAPSRLSEAGVGGYLGWDVLDEVKLQAGLAAAAAGLRFSTGGQEAEQPAPVDPRRPPPDKEIVLTDRKQEVLRGIAAGHENSELARRLKVSGRTVRRIIAELEEELPATNRSALAAWAVDLGLGPRSVA